MSEWIDDLEGLPPNRVRVRMWFTARDNGDEPDECCERAIEIAETWDDCVARPLITQPIPRDVAQRARELAIQRRCTVTSDTQRHA